MLPIDAPAVLTAVARLAAEAASLDELVPRLATLVSEAIPFERLHVLRLDRVESVVLYVARADGQMEVTGHRIADAAAGDAGSIDPDARSRIICTVGSGASIHGALWFTSSQPDAFSAAHQILMDGIADVLALAVRYDALRSTERLRRERLDTLDRLLQTMAEALDIRLIFAEASNVVRGALPHDVLALTSWADDGKSFRVYAMAGAQMDDPTFWAPTMLAQNERALLHRDPYIVHDTTSEIAPDSVRGRMFARLGVRSALRVPMPLGTGVFGSLFFLAHDPARFSESDLGFARRVADLLALALSHQQLAEAERRDAAARETAAQLEAKVATLTRELEARTGQRRVVGHSALWKDVLAHAARVAQTETTVLLTGESGTGKEVVARFIHQGSRRKNGPFVAINCAALPDNLLESELFGHERGAFTGAVAAKPGRIEQASGGVLFLDEVGEMSHRGSGEAPSRARGTRVPAPRQHAREPRRHPGGRSDQPRPSCRHAARRIPRGPVLPARGLRDRLAAAARTARRHPRARRRLPRRNRRHRRTAAGRHRTRRARPAARAMPGRGTCESCATRSSGP